jgi:ethanolamine ammonia-lyase large subunit
MLNYQSTSFHDALYIRRVLGKRPAPEFERWLEKIGLVDGDGRLLQVDLPAVFRPLLGAV